MYDEIKSYIAKMYGTQRFDAMATDEQDKAIFTASETLKDIYGEDISTRAIALQTLYMIESNEEAYLMLKRQGVSSFSTKGTSSSISTDLISPEVRAIYGETATKKTGKAGIGTVI